MMAAAWGEWGGGVWDTHRTTPQHIGPEPGFKLQFHYKHNPPNKYIFYIENSFAHSLLIFHEESACDLNPG